MRILFVTAASEAFGGRGPAARAAASLPKALRGLEHAAAVLTPLTAGIDPKASSLARRLTKLRWTDRQGAEHPIELWTGRSVSGVDHVFFGHETLFQPAASLHEGAPEDVARRIAAFSAAAVQFLAKDTEGYALVHGYGALGAAVVAAMKTAERPEPTVLTLDDEEGVLRFDGGAATELGLGEDAAEGHGAVPLLAGLRHAGRITASSPRRTQELREGEDAIASLVTERDEACVGVLDGIDASRWNPVTDPRLAARFDPVDLRGKATCKEALQRELDLPPRSDVPLLAAVGAARDGDGLGRLARIASELLRNDVQVAVLLSDGDDGALVGAFEDLWDRWPDRLQLRTRDEDGLQHRMMAAADLAYDGATAPAGHRVMVAQRYGAIPVAVLAGANADLMVDCDAKLETGTGIAIHLEDPAAGPSDEEVLAGLRRGLAALRTEGYDALRRRVMRLDHTWDRTARRYAGLYRELLAPPDDANDDG
ncbi:MAG: glycogen/starch synthase [Myxococcota bacterium]